MRRRGARRLGEGQARPGRRLGAGGPGGGPAGTREIAAVHPADVDRDLEALDQAGDGGNEGVVAAVPGADPLGIDPKQVAVAQHPDHAAIADDFFQVGRCHDPSLWLTGDAARQHH